MTKITAKIPRTYEFLPNSLKTPSLYTPQNMINGNKQKDLFKFQGTNVGELEMRNDSEVHYQEVRFNMIKPKVMNMLFKFILPKNNYNAEVFVYGKAIKTFGRWGK